MLLIDIWNDLYRIFMNLLDSIQEFFRLEVTALQ
jgi:hypothetical protein